MNVHPNASELARTLVDARSRTLALVTDLTDEQLMGPRLPIVNPLLWEIAFTVGDRARVVVPGKVGLAASRQGRTDSS
jgi:iron(II)-dependent oxidoreductase